MGQLEGHTKQLDAHMGQIKGNTAEPAYRYIIYSRFWR